MSKWKSAYLASAALIALQPQNVEAQTQINTATTGPIRTSQRGNISITEDGEVSVNTGAAIIVDSSNNVTNDGEISTGEDNGAVGILVRPGFAGTIVNTGDIIVEEDFVGDDDDDNRIADGAIARGINRYGIHLDEGGRFNGTINNDGIIYVEGRSSAGIMLRSELVGDLIHTGSIAVLGDGSVGVQTGDVTGDVQLRGSIQAVGRGSSAYISDGAITGELVLQGSMTQRTSYVNDDGITISLSRNDLRAGAPSVWIRDNVANGITVAVPPDNDTSSNDEDNDGFDDDEEGTGSIIGYGAAPALLIDGPSPIVIGATDSGYGLQIDGTVSGNGSVRGIDAVGVSIGGSGGASVNIEGGVLVSGRINATTLDSTATALLIAENARVPALEIQEGGAITSSISSTGDGASYAVRDLSGTLTSIRSNGFITANGSFEDTVVAIDLSANTSGVTITQYSPEDEDEDEEELVTTSINGNIRTGSGNDLIDASDGEIRGDSFLGAGNDTVRLSGDAFYRGDIAFGSGTGTLSIIDDAAMRGTLDFANEIGTVTIDGSGQFRGTVENGSRLSVDVRSGSFGAEDSDTIAFSNLTVRQNGTLFIYIDSDTGESSRFDVGTASFEAGSTIGANISSLDFIEGQYLVLRADSLSGTPTYGGEDSELPFLYAGQVLTDQAAGEITLEIRRKTASELGLDPVLDSALENILDSASADRSIEASLLAAESQALLENQLLALTPEYSGGNFDLVTRASRMAAANLSDPETMFDVSGVRIWGEGYGLSGKRDVASSGNYSLGGFGLTGGYEFSLGMGRIGLSGNLFWGSNTNEDALGTSNVTQYELGLHWRQSFGRLLAFARGSAGFVSLSRDRTFEGYFDGVIDDDDDDPDFIRTASSSSDAQLYSVLAGLSYRADFGSRLAVTPEISIEYFRFDEKGYEEEGGGDAMNLVVEDRLSDAANLNTRVVMRYALREGRRGNLPFGIDVTAGRRTNLAGNFGDTTANFEDGEAFTLNGRPIENAWTASLGVSGGGYDFKWFATLTGERESDQTTFGLRAGLGLAF